MNNISLFTKFGTARINQNGYYQISSSKEGNNGKLLHRLIVENYYKISLLPWAVVHHLDNDRLNNDIDNLTVFCDELISCKLLSCKFSGLMPKIYSSSGSSRGTEKSIIESFSVKTLLLTIP